MIASRRTSKAQTAIPQPVRVALHLSEGDELIYAIDRGHVVLTKAPPRRYPGDHDSFSTFDEWRSDAKHRAFAKL